MSHLTQAQRYEIALLKKENYSQNAIAERIKKDKSVISRELKRNCDLRNGEYKADLAQRKYQQRKEAKPTRINFTVAIREYVESKLRIDHSPEQIVGVSQLDEVKCVSAERIYQHIWADKKKGGNLYTHLRNNGRRYRKRGNSIGKRGIITGRIDIEQRPKIVEDRNRFGDIELDGSPLRYYCWKRPSRRACFYQ
jgi:IS30 family transposase